MSIRRLLSALALIVCVSPGSLEAGPVTGVIRTRTRAKMAPAGAIVFAEPLDSPAPRRPGEFSMAQKNRTFQPHALVIPTGSRVLFPNMDPVFHNVFSLSGPQSFDLGLYRAGGSRAHTFVHPGTYRVFCNIHPHMTALIVVVSTPYVATADGNGRYVLELPAGRYRLTALSARAAAASVDVMSGPGATMAPEIALDESAWVATPHKNKHGHDYPTATYQR